MEYPKLTFQSLADLEQRFTKGQTNATGSIHNSQTLAASSFQTPGELNQPRLSNPSPTHTPINIRSISSSDTHSLSSPQGPITTDGPLKTLNNFHEDETVEIESHDPIIQSIITEGEGYVLFRLQVFPIHRNYRQKLTLEVISRAAILMRHFWMLVMTRILKMSG